MIVRAFLICFLSLLVFSCSKKKTSSGRRPPAGNDFFLTQSSNLPDTQNDQGSANSEREYYDFNPYNETVNYYQEPTPKEVFAHHQKKNVFNMQEHIKQQNQESQTPEHKKPEQSITPTKENSTSKSSNQNSVKTPNTSSNKVVLKPRKKMGLVKIIPKENQSSMNNQASTSNQNQAPIQPVTLPNTASKDSISIDEALKYITDDLPLKSNSSNNTQTLKQQTNTSSQIPNPQTGQVNTLPQTAPAAPTIPNTNSAPVSTNTTPDSDDNPENKPIPLPFN